MSFGQSCVFNSKIESIELLSNIVEFSQFFSQILQVHAEDGDKGIPREIRYGLVSEGNPFTSFFDINDTTGESS
jgi:hypothetical protein